MYGRRAPWEDPTDWVIESYPWTKPGSGEWPSLLRLRPEDVGYDTQGQASSAGTPKASVTQQSDVDGDPLVSPHYCLARWLPRLNYRSPFWPQSSSYCFHIECVLLSTRTCHMDEV